MVKTDDIIARLGMNIIKLNQPGYQSAVDDDPTIWTKALPCQALYKGYPLNKGTFIEELK